jgi:hypothetical protein
MIWTIQTLRLDDLHGPDQSFAGGSGGASGIVWSAADAPQDQEIFPGQKNYPLAADAQWRFFYSFTRVSIAIQFTSQVLPPSVENDCSNLQDSVLMSEMMKRTRTGRPLKFS